MLTLRANFRGNIPLVVLLAKVEVPIVYILSTTILYLTLTSYPVLSWVSNDIVTTMIVRSHESLSCLVFIEMFEVTNFI